MTGTYDHRDERLRRQAEEELRARPPLPIWQKRVLERFAVERRNGWYTLLNQFAPHTPETRPDVVLVGPPGVVVVLLRDTEPDWETSRAAFTWTAELLAGVSTPHGLLTEAVVRTVVVQPLDRRSPSRTGEHLTISERELDRVLTLAEPVLRPADTLAVAAHLESRTFDLAPIAWNSNRIPEQRPAGATGEPPEPSGLFAVRDLRTEQLTSAVRGSFHDWRVFLDDSQLGLVRRWYGGPARITGPAGTGKSVIALHRLAYLARRTTGPLLFTTHVRTLAAVAQRQFASLAPQLKHRVEFTNLHAWARDFLAERGRAVEVNAEEVEAAFHAVWNRLAGDHPLRQVRPAWGYWKDEIDRVIKGRRIGTLESYRSVSRKGRGARLSAAFRPVVWEFYCEYERELTTRGVFDHNDVLNRALDELAREPLAKRYDAVVVDEVQDLTLVGLRLVHAISGDAANQLLLIGDGQQQVYAGGWRLSEAGIALHGRGEVLRRNYRNRPAILDLAGEVEAVNRFDDLDGGPSVDLRAALPVLEGGRAVRWHGADQEAAVLAELAEWEDTGDVAVLTGTNKAADRWRTTLREAGFPVVPLDRADAGGAVRVGTIHAAKGTEFRAVFLPQEPTPARVVHPEEWESVRRQWLVAMTRARDYLWIGIPEGTSDW